MATRECRASKQQTTVNILLVEDNDLLRSLAGEMLRELGHEVTAAATAEEALGMIDPSLVSLVMTDISLPGASGIELTRKVQSQYHDLPVVITSGHGEFNQTLLEKHFPRNVWWLQKPYDFDGLETVLRKAAGLV